MMKHSLAVVLALVVVGVCGQRFGDFDRGRGRGRPGFPGFFNPGFPFFPPPMFRFGNPIESIFCQSMQPDSQYRLTISSEGSENTFNVTGQELIDCLSEEGRRCSTSVIFNDDFLNCVEKAAGGGSNSTEVTTMSSVTESGSGDTVMRVSTMSPAEDSNATDASSANTAATNPQEALPAAEGTPAPADSTVNQVPTENAAPLNATQAA